MKKFFRICKLTFIHFLEPNSVQFLLLEAKVAFLTEQPDGKNIHNLVPKVFSSVGRLYNQNPVCDPRIVK